MKSVTLAARSVLIGELLLLLVAHATWAYVWTTVGFRPKYGNPESWSHPPLSTHPLLLYTPFVGFAVYFCWIPVAPIAATIAVVGAVRRRKDKVLIAWAIFAVVTTSFLYIDPFGALTWYLD